MLRSIKHLFLCEIDNEVLYIVILKSASHVLTSTKQNNYTLLLHCHTYWNWLNKQNLHNLFNQLQVLPPSSDRELISGFVCKAIKHTILKKKS